jgi:hypothetical protein
VCMLGLAAICWKIWKARIRTCFEKKPIESSNEILYSTCVFMRRWVSRRNVTTDQRRNGNDDDGSSGPKTQRIEDGRTMHDNDEETQTEVAQD